MRILITGGYGFVGANLYNALKKDKMIEVSKLPYPIDITDKNKMSEYFKIFNPEIVVHSAALVSSVFCDIAGKKLTEKVNVEGTKNVVELCDKHNAKIIYFGTTASYAPTNELITEESKIAPQTLYGKTKYEGEKIVKKSNDWLILRLAYIFGPNDRVSNIMSIINAWRQKRILILLANPNAKKDYLFISDAIEAIIRAIKNDLSGVYNISRQDARTFSQIVLYLNSKGINPVVYFRPEKDYLGTHLVSSEKFRKETGWKPKITVEEGIDKCLKR